MKIVYMHNVHIQIIVCVYIYRCKPAKNLMKMLKPVFPQTVIL